MEAGCPGRCGRAARFFALWVLCGYGANANAGEQR